MTRISGVWEITIAAYTIALQAGHRSPGTVRLHRYYLGRLAACAASPWIVTTADLRGLLSVPHWKPETRKSARAAYRSFYRWALEEGHVEVDPSARLAPIRVPAGVPKPTPEHVIETSLMGVGEREAFMVRLGAYAGLRCCEIARIHSDDYMPTLHGGILHAQGKGGKVREVPVVEPTLAASLAGVQGWAFPNPTTGEPITAGHVSRLLSRALEDRWTGHTLRHRMGTTALAETKDLLAVQRILGHSRPETTQRYCEVGDDRLWAVAIAASAGRAA